MSIKEPTSALNLDFKQQRTFVNYYRGLPEKPASTLRFFNFSDYYTLHSDDANLGSEFTGNIIKYMGEEPKLSYVILKKPQFDKFIRNLLLVKQYRIEVYVKIAANKLNEWKLEYKGSPGNLSQFEDILFDNTAITFNNHVMGVKIVRAKLIAVAWISSTELKFQVCEISDNECFSELEALIAQVGPRECIIPQGDSTDLKALRTVLERNGVLVARTKRSDFNTNDIIQDLNRLLIFHDGQQRNASSVPETNLTEALGCLNAVIKFLNLTADEQNFNQFRFNPVHINRYLRLDNAALFSLNIFPKPGSIGSLNDAVATNATKSFCLKGILDCCVTSQGRRLLEQWLKQPLKDLNLITERLDIVEYFVKNPEVRQLLHSDNLSRLPDLVVLSKKLSSKKANLQDCYKIYQIIDAIPCLIDVLNQSKIACVKSGIIDPIVEIKNDLLKFQSMIEETLDLELVDRGQFFIKRSFDPELDTIYENKVEIEEKIHKLLNKAASDLGFEEDKTIKVECNDQHGYFFRVTLKEEHALRSNSRYKIIDAVKGGVRFTNDKLLDLNNEYADVKKAYEDQQKSVITDIIDIAAGYGDSLRNLNICIATVDVFVAFATASVSARIPYVRPKLHEAGTGILKLIKARHPCIEQQDHISFIPNSVEFNENDNTLHIITGPNMCGKSTFIRSIGVCVLMAQIGCFVPCQSAEISLIDAILTRIGAEDCQVKGLSTFMLEMIETSTIIKNSTRNSLVIIDELGRGTSTYDGCGIAFAIAEHLANKVKCFTLFATHFHEITRLAEDYPNVKNLHVTALTTKDTMTPLYQIRDGGCDNSYGIHCAKIADFPEDVVKLAIKHQEDLEHFAGTKFIKNYESFLYRKEIKEGDEIIQTTLQELKKINCTNLNDEDLLTEIIKIKNKLLDTSTNNFIKGLLTK